MSATMKPSPLSPSSSEDSFLLPQQGDEHPERVSLFLWATDPLRGVLVLAGSTDTPCLPNTSRLT